MRGAVRWAVLALAVGAAACTAGPRAPTPTPALSAASEWPATHGRAQTEARESRFGIADRVLSDFAQRFAGSPEAAEVAYWRALYKLSTATPASSAEAVALLDSYLANTSFALHRTEAVTLRRLAGELGIRSPSPVVPSVVPAVRPEDKAHEEEDARIRDELAKTQAELARIKRRLARPKP